MWKNRTFLIVALAATILTAIFPIIVNAQSDGLKSEDSKAIMIRLTGLQANRTFTDVILSATLTGERAFFNTTNIGTLAAGESIQAILRVVIPSYYQNLNFSISLSMKNLTLLNASGVLELASMYSYYTSLYVNPLFVRSFGNAGLIFTSISVVGDITVKISTHDNVTGPFIATLTWRNQSRSIESNGTLFTFLNVSSSLPEIPFQINVSTNRVKNIVFAIGELRVTSEEISMPFQINFWSIQCISGWNITFICSEYATETRLPITISGTKSKVASTPGIYTGEFKKVSDQESASKSNTSQLGLLETIIGMLLTPTFLALITALAVIIVSILVIKLRRK